MKFLKEIIGFVFTFSLTFVLLFVLVNFSSVKSIFNFYFFGEKNFLKQEELLNKNKEISPLIPHYAKKHQEKNYPPLEINLTPLDYRLVIPKINVNVPIVAMSDDYVSADIWGDFEKEVQIALRDGIIHYPGTANPGQYGNAFFTGHSSYYPWDKGRYKDVFANLINLEINDKFYIYFQQKRYTYQIKSKKEVLPTEVGVLNQPYNEKQATLMTCWPLGTTLKRLIIVAEEIERL
jgi:sortase A